MPEYEELFQQGDVLFYKLQSLPKGLKKSKRRVLAEGEVTGHAHVIDEAATVLVDKEGNLFLSSEKQSTVKHDTHHPVELPPGQYEVRIVKEYDPFEDSIRKVSD